MSESFNSFHDVLAARTRQGAQVSFDLPADWLQGRTAYGGFAAAIAAQAMHDVAGADWPSDVRLRALQTNFIAPVAEGPVSVAVQVLREGKSVRQVQATLTSQGQVAALLVGVYGSPRASSLPTLAPQQPVARCAPQDAPTRAFVPDLMPNFLQHFAFGWSEGSPPGSGGGGWRISMFIRLLNDRADLIDKDVLAVLLADTPPSPAISHFRKPTPASSVCWALELVPLDTPVGADDWWRIDTEARSAGSGYVNHSSTLWSPAGQAAGFGHQVVTVYG